MSFQTPPTDSTRAQFLRFCVVGASGYAVNIGAFALSLALCAQHLVAAACGFAVAMVTNFWWNRRWTFATDHRALALQAARFFAISVACCLVAAMLLELLMGSAGLPALAAQPAAVMAATPLSFLGSRSWAFAEEEPQRTATAAPAPRLNTWLVVPTYNEAENLEPFVRAVLPRLAAAASEHQVLIVDDSSPDGTGDIADRLAAELDSVEVLHRAKKDGLGRAYAAGFERALAAGAQLVMQMDVDFSHDPQHVPALIAAAADADLAIGSRYVAGGGVTDWGLTRRLLSRGGSWYARTVLGVPVKDLTGGFKCFRRELLERLDPSSFRTAGFGFQVEVTYRALRSGARVSEVPIRFRDRETGTSKMSSRIVVEALWRVLALRLRAQPST
ncbi:MAG: dolichol-phosphate mannosyltransferase [Thermoleophilaceae bacterium]|nr:dolichol-phosphate mannosyltransferase [Thermoleophilaceae bacterium]